MFKKLRAFSLVELMMILLVASLIVAALVPVVTKKHFRLPSLVNHGAYMCYYKNGKLYEAKWAGKFQQQPIFERETDNCVFIPPKKAAYFQISAIGGGGGGGDAGYRGGNWVSSTTPEDTISPFGITRNGLLHMLDIEEDIPEAEADVYVGEVVSLAGTLMGYANSIGSSAGGNIGYAYTDAHTECTEYDTKIETWCAHETEYSDCTWSDETNSCSCVYGHYKDNCETYEDTETYQYCDKYECGECKTQEPYDCTGTHKERVNCRKGPDIKGYTSTCGGGCTAPGHKSGCDATGSQGCCYQECTKPGKEVCDEVDVPDTPSKTCYRCKEFYPTKYKPGTRKVTKTRNCRKVFYEDGSIGRDVTKEDCVGPYTYCDTEKSATVTDYDKCLHYKTTYTYNHSILHGESGGSGARCQSSRIPGGLGLIETEESTIKGKPTVGTSYDTTSIGACFNEAKRADSGNAICADGSEKPACPEPSYATVSISGADSSVVVKAESAAVGGAGAVRGGATTDGGGNCIDTTGNYTPQAKNGKCTSGTRASNCTGPGDTGYCLFHHYAPSVADVGGEYSFYYGYDLNYLGYGGAGLPGQFKTTIVRSLKDLDLTIKVGRGGSAAAINSGSQGATGSLTSMGEIISANGGTGGLGSLKKDAERLPTYNKTRHDKEKLCYYYDKYTAQNDDGSFRYNDADAVKLRQTLRTQPDYCEGLINNQGAYKFFQIAGNSLGDYPTPIGVFSSFMNIAFSNTSSSDLFSSFIRFGRGGTGGGVEHRCWAGRHDIVFEREPLSSSVFVDYNSATPYAKSKYKYVPNDCRNAYDNLPAGPGADGALLIKW